MLVIAEDLKYNGIILKPLVSAILGDAGKPRAKILVATLRQRIAEHLKGMSMLVDQVPTRQSKFQAFAPRTRSPSSIGSTTVRVGPISKSRPLARLPLVQDRTRRRLAARAARRAR